MPNHVRRLYGCIGFLLTRTRARPLRVSCAFDCLLWKAAYINGDGVAEGQVVTGARCLKEAASQGNKDAIEALEQLSQDPAWAQVEEALVASAEASGEKEELRAAAPVPS